MKKLLLLALSLIISGTMFGQGPCSDVFISEVVEGSGNDKAFELYNPTANAIDLSGYTLERFSNGGTTSASGGVLDLTGNTIAAYSTLVIVNGQTTVENGGTSPAVSPALQAMADVLDVPYPAPTYANGNDAIVLFKGGSSVVVDIFGKVGEDPGEAWTDDASAGYTDANGGTYWTKDQTLVRKATVEMGVTDVAITVFNPTLEYDSLPNNTWTELGQHVCNCDPNSIREDIKNNDRLFVYPNPVLNNMVKIRATHAISAVEVFDITGKLVISENITAFTSQTEIALNESMTGIYLVRTILANGSVLTEKITVK
jgi:hypothetical protein